MSQISHVYYAHSENKMGRKQPMAEHLIGVANLAKGFADPLGYSQEAECAGLLHDIGKYSDRFERRLSGQEKGLDHWSAGAWIALTNKNLRSAFLALAIQGHHVGLQKGDKESLRGLDPRRLEQQHPLGLVLTETNMDLLLQKLQSDQLSLTLPPQQTLIRGTASAMLDQRLFFSCLVDADFLDTERHMRDIGDGQSVRPIPIALQADRALARVQEELNLLQAQGDVSSQAIRQLRADLSNACIRAGLQESGLWTLTAPTGSGKTLSMLAFALQHALTHGLRRIVIVLPYLSIIEQTARIYRELFEPLFGSGYLIEHHSMTQDAKEDGDGQDAEGTARRTQRLLSENWDAPLILTTSVQFFESLFAHRPGACRKLHRLSRSVILFDEVQTFPLPLAVPTLKTLSRLVYRYGSSVVFSTATQPAFNHLHTEVQETGENQGWQPREIVPASLDLYARARRTTVDWSRAQSRTTWHDVAEWIKQVNPAQALCIVNLKRHARKLMEELARLLTNSDQIGLHHLSTSMCPAHRQEVLVTVRKALVSKSDCRLISTQCVEAGVDVDFPHLFRSFGPLEAIAQAAGRCNRNGNNGDGRVIVFQPDEIEERAYPSDGYAQASAVTRMLLREFGPERMDIHDPRLFETYFRRLYSIANMNDEGLRKAIEAQDYVEVASLYCLIEQDVVNVLVPYSQTHYDALANEVRDKGLSRDWIRRARPFIVSLFRSHQDQLTWLEATHLPDGTPSTDWFLCWNPESYHPKFGLTSPEEANEHT